MPSTDTVVGRACSRVPVLCCSMFTAFANGMEDLPGVIYSKQLCQVIRHMLLANQYNQLRFFPMSLLVMLCIQSAPIAVSIQNARC